jgi:hypothetical protein
MSGDPRPRVGAPEQGRSTAQEGPRGEGFAPPPPSSDTGVQITDRISIHWLAGSFDQEFEDIADLVSSVAGGEDFFPLPHGKFGYKAAYMSIGGLLVLTDPGSPAMPRVHVSVPGQACEFLGLDKLRVLFCNALNLTRVDVAFDGYRETPTQLAQWVEEGNIRTRARRESCEFTRNLGGGGSRLYIGAISSTWSLCAYDSRGFTRLELRLKKERAALFQSILLGEVNALPRLAVGLLGEFVDVVDTSDESNVSRAPLLPSWKAFTMGIGRVKLALQGVPEITVDRVVLWIEHQVAATLAVYEALGKSVADLVCHGRGRMRGRQRALILSGAGRLSAPNKTAAQVGEKVGWLRAVGIKPKERQGRRRFHRRRCERFRRVPRPARR